MTHTAGLSRIAISLLAISLALGIADHGFAAPQPKPNILFFFIDDMGWQDTSVPFHTEKTELNRRYRTPNMAIQTKLVHGIFESAAIRASVNLTFNPCLMVPLAKKPVVRDTLIAVPVPADIPFLPPKHDQTLSLTLMPETKPLSGIHKSNLTSSNPSSSTLNIGKSGRRFGRSYQEKGKTREND